MVSAQTAVEITFSKQEEDAIFSRSVATSLMKHCQSHGIKCSISVEGSSRPDEVNFAGRYYSERLTVTFKDGVQISLIASQSRADWIYPAANLRFPRDYDYSMVLKPNGIKVYLNDVPFERVIPKNFIGYDLAKVLKEFRTMVTILGQAEPV